MTGATARRWVGRLLVGAFMLLCAVGLADALRGQDWTAVGHLVATGDRFRLGVLVAGALLANATGLLCTMLMWVVLLRESGPPVPTNQIARIFFVGFLAKYVPGRFLAVVASFRIARGAGVSAARMVTAVTLSLIVTVLSGLMVGMLAGTKVLGQQAWWLLLAVLPVVAVTIRPDLVDRIGRLAVRLVRRPTLKIRASDRGVRLSIAAQTLSWLVSGLHLWLLAIAAGAPALRSLAICVGAFSLAVVVGMAVLLIPDGVGVREAILVGALSTVLPLPAATVVVLASRVVCTFSEVGLALLAFTGAELVRRLHASHSTEVVCRMESPDRPQCAVDEGVSAMRPVEQTLVSVVIPNWNRERAIALCIDSVRMQNYPHIEILVVDDRSTDNSPRIAAELGATVLTTQVNSGPPLARNIGAARARGDIFFFLDSDVALEPDAIATAVRILEADVRIGALTGLLRAEPLLGLRRIEEYRAMQLHCWSYRVDGPTPGNQIHTALFAVRRAVWDEVGPIDPGRRYDEGSEYGRRLSAHGYTVCAVRAVTGRKDSDSTLGVIVSKVYMRSRAHALKRGPGAPLAGGGGRIVASMLTAVAVPLLALPAFVGPVGLLAPVIALACAIVLDAGTYRYVFTHRGPWFGLYFTAMQQVFNLSSAVGGGIGTLQRMSVRFRPSRNRKLNHDRGNGTAATSQEA